MKGITVAQLVFGTLTVASAVIVIRWLVPWDKTRVDLGAPMGKGSWDPNTSWASNFTLLGAVLGSIMVAGMLPNTTKFFTTTTYSALYIFFGALILLAPFVYVTTRTHDPGSTDLHGYVWSFLLSSLITLWAVLGELVTIAFLLNELSATGSVPNSVAYVFVGLMFAAALLMLYYLWTGIPYLIGQDVKGLSKKPPRTWTFF